MVDILSGHIVFKHLSIYFLDRLASGIGAGW